jgi:hydrogenase nickel incorporation protein HypA/HybF
MHELQIAESVVEMLHECRQGRGVRRVRLLVGRRWTVVPDTLQFCFELATVGTPIEGAELKIDWGPGRDLSVTAVEVV